MESRPYSSRPSSPLQARGTSALLLHQSPWCSTPFSATLVQFRAGKPLLSLCLLVLCLGCRTDPILHFDSHRVVDTGGGGRRRCRWWAGGCVVDAGIVVVVVVVVVDGGGGVAGC